MPDPIKVPTWENARFIRDAFQINWERKLRGFAQDETVVRPIMNLSYHADVRSSSTGGNDSFAAAVLEPSVVDPKVEIGKKTSGVTPIVVYKGTWNIANITVEDGHNGITRVTFNVYREGKFTEPAAGSEEELLTDVTIQSDAENADDEDS